MTAPRILVCGNRDWTHAPTIARWMRIAYTMCTNELHLLRVRPTLIHGECGARDTRGIVIRGADLLANDIAKQWGWTIESYPADWDRYGNRAGPIRNAEMLELGKPTIGLAFGVLMRNGYQSGTGDMVSGLGELGVPVILIGATEGT